MRFSVDNNTQSEFQTRAGICTITPVEIAFRRPDPNSRGSVRAPLLAVLFASLFFGLGIFLFLFGETLLGVLFVILGIGLRWQQVRAGSGAVAPNIPRQAIRKVEAHAPFLTRGYFTVEFELDGKLFRQRIIVQGGKDEYLRAVEVMRAAGLLPA